MDKRYYTAGIVVVVLVAVIVAYPYLSGLNLSTQLLNTTDSPTDTTTFDDCIILSEKSANDCYQDIAVREKDASVCDQISKPSLKKVCQREVQLSQ